MAKFRKKPVVIEAFQWSGSNLQEITIWAAHADHEARKRLGNVMKEVSLPIDVVGGHDGALHLEIKTEEGVMRASHGDWIICGVLGEFYPCRNDIFEQTYEAV